MADILKLKWFFSPIVVINIISLIALPRDATGQTCVGNPRLSLNRAQASLDVSKANEINAYGAGLQIASNNLALTTRAVSFRDRSLDQSVLRIATTAARSFEGRRIGVCPFASFAFGTPSKFQSVANQAVAISQRNISIGTSLGWAIRLDAGIEVIPNASINYGAGFLTLSTDGRRRLSWREFSGEVSQGFMVRIADQLSIGPSITIPFLAEDSEPIYSFQFVLGLRGRK